MAAENLIQPTLVDSIGSDWNFNINGTYMPIKDLSDLAIDPEVNHLEGYESTHLGNVKRMLLSAAGCILRAESQASKETKKDKADRSIALGLTRAILANPPFPIVEGDSALTEKLMVETYMKLGAAAKKEGIKVPPEYAHAIYTEAMPILMTINGISKQPGNKNEYNSIDQLVATGLNLLKAYEVVEKGGIFSILAPKCVSTDARATQGDWNSLDSYTNLLPTEAINQAKIDEILLPYTTLAGILNKFNIPVNLIVPKFDLQDPRVLYMMIHSITWSYAEQGRIPQLNKDLEDQAIGFQNVLESTLQLSSTDRMKLINPSFAEQVIQVNGQKMSIIDRAFDIAEKFFSLFDDKIKGGASFFELPENILFNMLWVLEDDYDELFAFAQTNDNYTPEDIVALKSFMRNLRSLSEYLLKFYNQRQKSSYNWIGRKINITEEAEFLMQDPTFANLHQTQEDKGAAHAQKIIEEITRLCESGLGTNVLIYGSIYVALGEYLTTLNSNNNVAVMIPLEEAAHGNQVHILNNTYTSRNSEDSAPLVYPREPMRFQAYTFI